MVAELKPWNIDTLEFFFQEYLADSKLNATPDMWGFGYADIDKPLLDAGVIAVSSVTCADGVIEQRAYITQAGAEYLKKDVKITSPFDTENELAAARAEIARLTAALAESEAARKVADAGWSECIDVNEELRLEITLLKTDSGIPFE